MVDFIFIWEVYSKTADIRKACVMFFGEITLLWAIRYLVCCVFLMMLDIITSSSFGYCSIATFVAKLWTFIMCGSISELLTVELLRSEIFSTFNNVWERFSSVMLKFNFVRLSGDYNIMHSIIVHYITCCKRRREGA